MKTPPSLVHAASHIPRGFKVGVIDGVLRDVEPSIRSIDEVEFLPVVRDGEDCLWWSNVAPRALEMGGNLGLADLPVLIRGWKRLPQNRGVLLPGTILSSPDGELCLAVICLSGGRYRLSFPSTGREFGARDRLGCKKP